MSNSNYPRGSEWRKWDLHVHTPESFHNQYPGNLEDAWDSFLDDLENLPPEFKVIGINDYLFIDGYKRVLKERENGRLENIDLVLPVIELRLDKFGGTTGPFSKVNYHVIFSDKLKPKLIEQQFLNALSRKFILSPEYDNLKKQVSWAASPTKESLEELGNMIINSAPEEERKNYDSPLREGFNNLCFSLESIQSALESHYFEGSYMTAVGKTEWSNIKWTPNVIGDKKSIINGADLVFISAETPEAWYEAKKSLIEGEVNSCLLDCSDAHNLSNSTTKDRIGKCFTWIKADSTFKGLQQILHEPEGRIFVGDKPSSLFLIDQKSTKYMREITFQKTEKAKAEEIWFSGTVPLNHGLVAIIGNKGSGKSALADILALLGNTHVTDDFSFLTKDRFLAPKTMLGEMFEAIVLWHSGTKVSAQLNQLPMPTSLESVKYIPQNYLETICSDLQKSKDTQFYSELMEVIYSHVSDEERLGKETLTDLINYLTNEKEKLIDQLLDELEDTNTTILDLENHSTVEYKKSLEAHLSQRMAELKAHINARPLEIKEPKEDIQAQEKMKNLTDEIAKLKSLEKELDEKIESIKEIQRTAHIKIAAADNLLSRIDNLKRHMRNFQEDSNEDILTLELDLKKIVLLNVDSKPVLEVKSTSEDQILETKILLDSNIAESLVSKLENVKSNMKKIHMQLDEPNRKYQIHLVQLVEWKKKRDEMIGTSEEANSIKGLKARLESLKSVPLNLQNLKSQRMNLVSEIYSAKIDLLSEYTKLYSPVQEFISQHRISKQHGVLQFSASIMVNDFVEGFLSMIHQGKKGSFQGDKEGRETLKEIISISDFSTIEGVQSFLHNVQEHLDHDKRDGKNKPVNLHDQLRQSKSPDELYNFLYGLQYLEPRFELKWHNKPLDQLSPGERGNLLLLFYLLIDKRDIPLIIDQPEENLDNQTIANMLVPAIKEAKERRQIIIVTHNPNLAVVCDADQIIHAQLDKANGNKVTYTAGSIENPIITKFIVDVLEGTKPAFDLRDAKYDILED